MVMPSTLKVLYSLVPRSIEANSGMTHFTTGMPATRLTSIRKTSATQNATKAMTHHTTVT